MSRTNEISFGESSSNEEPIIKCLICGELHSTDTHYNSWEEEAEIFGDKGISLKEEIKDNQEFTEFLKRREQVTQKSEGRIPSKLTKSARKRIDLLLDSGTFQELGVFVCHNVHRFGMENRHIPGDGVVTGFGQISGKEVCIYALERSVFGGSLGEAAAQKICRLLDHSIWHGMPIIGLIDSAGARIQEGVGSLGGFGEVFRRNVRASGLIPQISVIFGPSAGGAVYSPALTDFVIMVERTSQMFLTGPDVVEATTGQRTSLEDLGGSNIHATKSGVAHLIAKDEKNAIQAVRNLLTYLPQNNTEHPPNQPQSPCGRNRLRDLTKIASLSPKVPYDMHKVLLAIVDNAEILELQKKWAPNIITAFARLGGLTVGLVANQPEKLCGVLDINSAEKAARFVRFCDAFNIPILTLVDVPGFLPGVDQEHNGIIKHGAKLLFAYSEASVTRITVVIRKAYGGAYIVMGSKHLGTDICFAWPTAEIAVMGAPGAVKILYKRDLAQAENSNEIRKELEDQYKKEIVGPYVAAERGFIDDIILPEETRPRLITVLRTLASRSADKISKKHGNIPL